MGNIAYILNAIILIVYFFLSEDNSIWPNKFNLFVWLPYLANVYLDHFFDGLQNTTRNIARIYLIQQEGINYNRSQIEPIQHLLIPDAMFLRSILWLIVHVLSFTLILLFQGWGTALVAEVALAILGGFIPINYQAHLRRIQQNLPKAISSKGLVTQMTIGIVPQKLQELIDHGIAERKNPQRWWAEVLQKVSIDSQNKNSP